MSLISFWLESNNRIRYLPMTMKKITHETHTKKERKMFVRDKQQSTISRQYPFPDIYISFLSYGNFSSVSMQYLLDYGKYTMCGLWAVLCDNWDNIDYFFSYIVCVSIVRRNTDSVLYDVINKLINLFTMITKTVRVTWFSYEIITS